MTQPRLRAQSETLTENVFRHLADAIVDGRCAPGESLELAEIAQELRISRMPVREAVKRLVPLGLVEIEASRWTRVVQVTPASSKAAAEFAASLAGAVARLAVPKLAGAPAADAASAGLGAMIAADARRALLLASTDFVSALAEACGNAHLREAWSAARLTVRFHVGALLDAGHAYEIDTAPTLGRLERAFASRDADGVASHLHELFLPPEVAACGPVVEAGTP